MNLLETPQVFTLAMKREAIAREIKQREHVYPRRVSDGKMTQKKADYELAVMRAIGTDYAEPLLTDRQIELIRVGLRLIAETHTISDDEASELHGINDALRDMQRRFPTV